MQRRIAFLAAAVLLAGCNENATRDLAACKLEAFRILPAEIIFPSQKWRNLVDFCMIAKGISSISPHRRRGALIALTKSVLPRPGGLDFQIRTLPTIEIAGVSKRFLIVCKDFDASGAKVVLDILRSFRSVIEDTKADEGIVITCNGFTQDAQKYARSRRAGQLQCPNHGAMVGAPGPISGQAATAGAASDARGAPTQSLLDLGLLREVFAPRTDRASAANTMAARRCSGPRQTMCCNAGRCRGASIARERPPMIQA
jgi:hypothetical protein